MLGWLLDPGGDHGLGDSFLTAFLELGGMTGTVPGPVTVNPEVRFEEGAQPDLVIEAPGFYAVLEVKVRMGALRADQLRSENKGGRVRAGEGRFPHFLLLPPGEIPSGIRALQQKLGIKEVRWAQVALIIARCNESATEGTLRSILQQYEAFVREVVLMEFRGFDEGNAEKFVSHVGAVAETQGKFEREAAAFLEDAAGQLQGRLSRELMDRFETEGPKLDRQPRDWGNLGARWQAFNVLRLKSLQSANHMILLGALRQPKRRPATLLGSRVCGTAPNRTVSQAIRGRGSESWLPPAPGCVPISAEK